MPEATNTDRHFLVRQIQSLTRQEDFARGERDRWQREVGRLCQERQRLEATLNGQTTVEEQILAAAREAGPDECDRCYAKRELYHCDTPGEWEGAALCGECDGNVEAGI